MNHGEPKSQIRNHSVGLAIPRQSRSLVDVLGSNENDVLAQAEHNSSTHLRYLWNLADSGSSLEDLGITNSQHAASPNVQLDPSTGRIPSLLNFLSDFRRSFDGEALPRTLLHDVRCLQLQVYICDPDVLDAMQSHENSEHELMLPARSVPLAIC